MVYLENSLLEQDVWISRSVTNGNITSSPFITEAELEEALTDYPTTEEVEAMVSGAVNTGLVQTMIDDSLVPYWTSAQTNSAITDATSAFTTTGDVADMISAFVTTGDVQTQIDISLLPYWTSAQTNSAITDATSAFTTSGDVEDMMHYRIVDDFTEIENPEHGDMATLRGRAGFIYSIGTSNPFGSIDNVEILQFTYNGTTYHIYTYETDDVFGFYSYELVGNVEYPVIDKHNGKLVEGVQMSGLIGSGVIGRTYPLEFKITNYGATYFFVEFGSISSALSATNVFQSSAFLPELDKIKETDITYYPMYPYFYDGSKWVYNPQEFITKAEMEQFPTYGEVEAMITAATTAFTTTAQVQEEIGSSLENYYDKDEVDAIISGLTPGGVTTGDVQTMIDNSLTEYWTSAATENAITAATSAFTTTGTVNSMITAATSGFTTSGDVNTQIGTSLIPYWTSAQTNSAITSATENMATTGVVENMITAATSAFTTTAQVQSQITSALTGYNPTNNFKTINNNSIIGTCDITIQGGGSNVSWNQITTAGTKIAEVTINSATTDVYAPSGGGGGEQVVELTQAQYLALTAYSQNTTYVITDADYIDMDQYYTSGETNAAIQAATSGKQDSITTTANSSNRNFPLWNANGQITGKTGNNVSSVGFSVNGSNQTGILRDNSSSNLTGIYAPTAVGSNGNLLRSTGSGAPSWASPATLNLVESTTLRTIVICSQTDYDNMQSHDSATIYIIND